MSHPQDDPMVRMVFITGLVLLGATITLASSAIRGWVARVAIEPLIQSDMDLICDTVSRIEEKENELQWKRDRHRITFVGTDDQYIESHMRWVVPFVTQTVPNSVWCAMNKKNVDGVVFVSPANGLSVHRLSDSHVRCYLQFTAMLLDENNIVIDGVDGMKSVVDIVYDVVDIGMAGDDASEPHILLVKCN
jgi:hypothetical protein